MLKISYNLININSTNVNFSIEPTTSDIQLLIDDFNRFSRLHSWYKHLPIDGKVFIFMKIKGQQPRNIIHPSYTDTNPESCHWHWYDLIECSKEFLKKLIKTNQSIYVVKFGPLLYLDNCSNTNAVRGFHFIKSIYEANKIKYLLASYPEYTKELINLVNNFMYRYKYGDMIQDICKREQQKYLNNVLQFNLWKPDSHYLND